MPQAAPPHTATSGAICGLGQARALPCCALAVEADLGRMPRHRALSLTLTFRREKSMVLPEESQEKKIELSDGAERRGGEEGLGSGEDVAWNQARASVEL